MVKKLGPSPTAGYLMDWEQDWAAISIGVETAQFPAHASAGQDYRHCITDNGPASISSPKTDKVGLLLGGSKVDLAGSFGGQMRGAQP